MFQSFEQFVGEYIEESMHCGTRFDFQDFRMYMLHGYQIVVPDDVDVFDRYLRVLSKLN
jgi:hypothetical protein